MVYKSVYMILAANSRIHFLFARFAYQEAGLIASGISYKAPTEDTPQIFNSLRCVNILQFMWSSNPRDAISFWNMRTQEWLKYYVMLRFTNRSLPRGQLQPWALAGTFAVSAAFHGYYHGYYSFFFALCVIDVAWKIGDSTAFVGKLRAIFPAWLITLISIALAQLELRYLTVPFFILTWKGNLVYYQAFYFLGHIIPLACIVIGLLMPKQKKQSTSKTQGESECPAEKEICQDKDDSTD